MEKTTNIQNALQILSAKICGTNLAYKINSENNTAQIISTKDGVFLASEKRLKNFNELSNKAILNAIFPYSLIVKNQIIAELEVNENINNDDVDNIIFSISGNTEILNIVPKEKKTISIISIIKDNSAKEATFIRKTTQRLKKSLSFLTINFTEDFYCQDNAKELDDAIYSSQRKGADIAFVINPSKNKTMIEKTINKSFDNIACNHFPEIGVSDIIIAFSKKQKIIALPYNYHSIHSFNLEAIINKAILTQKLSVTDFLSQSPISLNKTELITDTSELITPNSKSSINKHNIAGVILAAGTSSRAKTNKLLFEDKNGEPLFLKPIKEALKAGISPIFVVLGHRQEEMQERLEGLDVNIVINQDYYAGVKSSIDLGMKSLPSFCKGAFLIPADMAHITAKHLENMLKEFDDKKPKQLIISEYKGIAYNPTLWSKEIFDFANLVPENSINRAFFLSHRDYTKTVSAKKDCILKDITFPADLKEFE